MARKSPAPTNLLRAEYVRSVYAVIVPEGVTLDEVKKPDFWVHVRTQMRANDIIEAQAADGSFDAAFRVMSISAVTGMMTFRMLWEAPVTAVPLSVVKPSSPAGEARYEVRHKGHGKYIVIETFTGNIVSDGLSKEDAEHEKAILETQRNAA